MDDKKQLFKKAVNNSIVAVIFFVVTAITWGDIPFMSFIGMVISAGFSARSALLLDSRERLIDLEQQCRQHIQNGETDEYVCSRVRPR